MERKNAGAAQVTDGMKKMKVIGITGGVGSGKSEVLRLLEEEYGAYVCQMDEVARKIQRKGTRCFRDIVETFGEVIVGEDGELDRKALAGIIFRDEGKRKLLNDIVHPSVLNWVREDIARRSGDGTALYVVEAALLPGAGRELCDEMWYIFACEPVRRKRLAESRGYTQEKITEMIKSQLTEKEFRQACPVVIDNSGSLEQTKRQINGQMNRLFTARGAEE